MISFKTLYWITCLVIYIGYLFFPRKKEGRGEFISLDFEPLIRFGISTILYLISWIIWFIIFSS
jgi:hypothetical protein